MNVVVASFNRLDLIKRKIVTANDHIIKGGKEWIDGSLEMAAALMEARDSIPDNVGFSDWLEQNNLAFFNPNDRAALINLASNIELARSILAETDSRSYRLIWESNKSRYSSPANTTKRHYRKRTYNPGRAMNYRIQKLGEDTMNKIKGTSLDSAVEMDELIVLDRGGPKDGHTEIVNRLVAAAAAGENVSAIAEGVKMGGTNTRNIVPLQAAWKKRMVAAWTIADFKARKELIHSLFNDLTKPQRDELLDSLLNTLTEGTTP